MLSSLKIVLAPVYHSKLGVFVASRASQFHHLQNNIYSNFSTALLSANGSIIFTPTCLCCLEYLHFYCFVSLSAKGTVRITTALWTVFTPLKGSVFVVIQTKEKNFVVIIHGSRPTEAPFDHVEAPAQPVHVAFECHVTLMSMPSICSRPAKSVKILTTILAARICV